MNKLQIDKLYSIEHLKIYNKEKIINDRYKIILTFKVRKKLVLLLLWAKYRAKRVIQIYHHLLLILEYQLIIYNKIKGI